MGAESDCIAVAVAVAVVLGSRGDQCCSCRPFQVPSVPASTPSPLPKPKVDGSRSKVLSS